MKRFSEGSESSASGGGGNGTGLGFTEGKGLSWLPEQATVQPHRLTDVIHGITQQQWRISLPGLFGNEVARVLGGGLAPGFMLSL
jgi:DNA repair protein RadA/Sms